MVDTASGSTPGAPSAPEKKPVWWKTLARKGPLAIYASSLVGVVNYFIVLYLSFAYSAEATGTFRLIISVFMLVNLFAVYESSKVYVRSVAEGDKGAGASLLVNQLGFSAAILAVCALATLVDAMFNSGALLPKQLLVVAVISAVYMPTQCYMAFFQSRRWFLGLAVTETLKYGSALLAFMVSIWSGLETTHAVYAQLSAMAFWNVLLFAIFARQFINFSLIRERTLSLFRDKAAGDARVISLSVLVPGTLEHMDKLLLAATHGVAAVGVYTLGYSTGRFLYNTLKPATYVFWRGYVDTMPSPRILGMTFLGFTAFGACLALLFLALVEFVPGMGIFREARSVTIILFLSYGISLTDAIYTQAYSINKDRSSRDLLIANTLGGLISMALIVGSAFIATTWVAMIGFALHYPLRHFAVVMILWRLDAKNRRAERAQADLGEADGQQAQTSN